MQVKISGQHMVLGSSLQEYVENRLIETVSKYFAEAPSGNVHFSKQGRSFVCSIVVNEGTGRHVVIKSEYTCDDVYSSFDVSLSKLEKQLRKYRSKLKNHSKKRKVSEALPEAAINYIISTAKSHDSFNEAEEFDADNPTIVAEDSTDIMSLSVGDAVMKMDLENIPALMFKNSKTERMNIVYYRSDGNISWVDSK